jgi:hypothetical protein
MGAPFNTYQDPITTGSLKNDLYPVIKTISPEDTPMLSGMKVGPNATATTVEWLTRVLATPASNARVEGASISYTANTAPSRVSNLTQILYKDYQLSWSMEGCDYIGGSPLAREVKFKTIELKNDMEYNLINSTTGAGSDNVSARTMKGVVEAITTNVVTGSGLPLDADTFNKAAKKAYDQGGKPTECYVCPAHKIKISSWLVNNTRTIPAEDKRLVNNVLIYEGPFSTQKILVSRMVPQATDNATFLMIDPELWEIAFTKNGSPQKIVKANSADVIENGIVRTEFTVRYFAENGNVKGTGFGTDGM